MAITKNGKLLTWGWNNYGQCGQGSSQLKAPIREVRLPGTVVDADGGFQHTFALTC